MERIIVSRHAAAIEFIRQAAPEFADAPIFGEVTAAEVATRPLASVRSSW